MSSVQEMSSFSTLYSFLYTLIVIAICYNDYNMQLFYCQAITPQCSISRSGMACLCRVFLCMHVTGEPCRYGSNSTCYVKTSQSNIYPKDTRAAELRRGSETDGQNIDAVYYHVHGSYEVDKKLKKEENTDCSLHA